MVRVVRIVWMSWALCGLCMRQSGAAGGREVVAGKRVVMVFWWGSGARRWVGRDRMRAWRAVGLLAGVGVGGGGGGGWERMRVRRLMSGWERSERENGIGCEVGRVEAMDVFRVGRGWLGLGLVA